jgi:hypothetical protein
MPSRITDNAGRNEFELSVFVTIENIGNLYVCLHEIMEYVIEKTGCISADLNWRHNDDKMFVFSLPNKTIKDRFLEAHKRLRICDAMVRFDAWKPLDSGLKSEKALKVWLKLTGVPIEFLTFQAAEVIVSPFGTLSACNLELTKTFVGAFYVNIDAVGLDHIEGEVSITINPAKSIPVTVEKMYACPLHIYKRQLFDMSGLGYDAIIRTLIERGMLTAIYRH